MDRVDYIWIPKLGWKSGLAYIYIGVYFYIPSNQLKLMLVRSWLLKSILLVRDRISWNKSEINDQKD